MFNRILKSVEIVSLKLTPPRIYMQCVNSYATVHSVTSVQFVILGTLCNGGTLSPLQCTVYMPDPGKLWSGVLYQGTLKSPLPGYTEEESSTKVHCM